ITLKALQEDELRKKAIIFGSLKVVEYYANLLKIDKAIKVISSMGEFDEEYINIVDVVSISMSDFEIGKVFSLCGDAAYQYVERAIEWAMEGQIKAVVTAPL